MAAATYALSLNFERNKDNHLIFDSVLEKEVVGPNLHVADLITGRAPVSSYADPGTKHDRWLLYSGIPFQDLKEVGYKLTGKGDWGIISGGL